MRRLIQSEIEDRLAEEILAGRLTPGSTAMVGARAGKIRVSARKGGVEAPQGEAIPKN